VEIDRESDLYSSFANAQAVVAETSTALFEALGLVERVFAWDTPKSRFYLGSHPFESALDAYDFVARLAGPKPSDAAASASLWADDWESRFQEFLGRAIHPGAGHSNTEGR
jgi:hypothetical protein